MPFLLHYYHHINLLAGHLHEEADALDYYWAKPLVMNFVCLYGDRERSSNYY